MSHLRERVGRREREGRREVGREGRAQKQNYFSEFNSEQREKSKETKVAEKQACWWSAQYQRIEGKSQNQVVRPLMECLKQGLSEECVAVHMATGHNNSLKSILM